MGPGACLLPLIFYPVCNRHAFRLVTGFVLERTSGLLPAILGIGGVAFLASTAVPETVFALAAGYALLIVCTVAGVVIGRRIVDPGYLWPLTIVMVAFDLWSVGSAAGVTQTLVLDPEATTTRAILVLSFPIVGLSVEPVLGIGDVIVVGLLYSAVSGMGLSVRALSVGLAGGFLCCLVSLVIFQVPLPALAFIAPLGVEPSEGRLDRPLATWQPRSSSASWVSRCCIG